MPLEVLKEKNNPHTQKGYADTGNSEKEYQINTKEQIDKTDKIDKTMNDSQKSKFVYDNDYSELTNDLIKRGYIDQFDTEKIYMTIYLKKF